MVFEASIGIKAIESRAIVLHIKAAIIESAVFIKPTVIINLH